jgi:rhodanese-related sulfurtransferase
LFISGDKMIMAMVIETNCSVESLKEKLTTRTDAQTFIDVRTPGEYKGAHIIGVENIPLNVLDKQIQQLSRFQEVYVSCHNGMRTSDAVKKLRARGIHAIPVEGGIAAWRKAGFPVMTGASGSGGAIPVMRQVQIIFGTLVLLGLSLSQWVHPAFIGFTIFVGVGLLIAGLTGWCGFVMFLDKMPWNKA